MLYLCATPIGNLGDITLRVIDALKSCDAVYCEDTRHTLGLLNHLGIEKPLRSCHQHNEKMRAEEIAQLLCQGQTVVYVSDAGMPGISDPGAALVQTCIARNLDFTVLPGASAVLTAAVLSGLPPQPFTFFGFLPRENKPLKETLEAVAACGHLALLYESPQRVQRTLASLLEVCGDRPAAVLRELTKKFEQTRRGLLSELIPQYETPPKGECVIAVYCPPIAAPVTQTDLDAFLQAALDDGSSTKDAAAAASQALGTPRKLAYQRALALSKRA